MPRAPLTVTGLPPHDAWTRPAAVPTAPEAIDPHLDRIPSCWTRWSRRGQQFRRVGAVVQVEVAPGVWEDAYRAIGAWRGRVVGW